MTSREMVQDSATRNQRKVDVGEMKNLTRYKRL